MTAAERMRDYRARKRNPRPPPKDINECLARSTRKEQARYVGKSVRSWYYVKEFCRYSEIEWEGDVLNGKYGRIGIAFLAWVCRYGDATVQQMVHDRIKEAGAAAGRALWRDLLFQSRQQQKTSLLNGFQYRAKPSTL
jgi:hypothetical protein